MKLVHAGVWMGGGRCLRAEKKTYLPVEAADKTPHHLDAHFPRWKMLGKEGTETLDYWIETWGGFGTCYGASGMRMSRLRRKSRPRRVD